MFSCLFISLYLPLSKLHTENHIDNDGCISVNTNVPNYFRISNSVDTMPVFGCGVYSPIWLHPFCSGVLVSGR